MLPAIKHVAISLLLSYAPSKAVLNPTDYKISRYILHYCSMSISCKLVGWKKACSYCIGRSWKAIILRLSENMSFLCFCILRGTAETLFKGGGKINQLLIAQSLSNVFAKKNCKSPSDYVY